MEAEAIFLPDATLPVTAPVLSARLPRREKCGSVSGSSRAAWTWMRGPCDVHGPTPTFHAPSPSTWHHGGGAQ